MTKAINSGYGLPLMLRLVKLWVVISVIALENQLRSYGNRGLPSIANVQLEAVNLEKNSKKEIYLEGVKFPLSLINSCYAEV